MVHYSLFSGRSLPASLSHASVAILWTPYDCVRAWWEGSTNLGFRVFKAWFFYQLVRLISALGLAQFNILQCSNGSKKCGQSVVRRSINTKLIWISSLLAVCSSDSMVMSILHFETSKHSGQMKWPKVTHAIPKELPFLHGQWHATLYCNVKIDETCSIYLCEVWGVMTLSSLYTRASFYLPFVTRKSIAF